MHQNMLMIVLFVVIIAAFGLMMWLKHLREAEEISQVIALQVTFRERETTLKRLDAYFASKLISILSVRGYMEGGEGVDLYTNEYKLFLPSTMTPTELVGQLSAWETVQSVHIGTE